MLAWADDTDLHATQVRLILIGTTIGKESLQKGGRHFHATEPRWG